mgnify:CR=1 FL=1
MKVTEINKPIKEYRNVVTPRDETHYRDDVMDPILKSMIPSLIDNLVDVRTGQFRPRKNCVCL